ncbi:hypothetical protein GCM10022419_054230 [Nonomuraea rosea]|uniref:Uncharacterized protein n=1 Tax=Nonomuraea rosea TaxID=638574 RepID=A0ABP6XIJ5_9ACTN
MSAVSLISAALTSQPNAFQLLNPIGGVAACTGAACAGPGTTTAPAINKYEVSAATARLSRPLFPITRLQRQ